MNSQHRRERCHYCEIEDLLQIGFLALRACVLGFDTSRGLRLSTYAYRSIIQELDAHIRCSRVIRIPSAAHTYESTRAFANAAS